MKISNSVSDKNTGSYGLIFGGLCIFGLVSIYIAEMAGLLPALTSFSCIFKRLTSIPCLTCGSTRAISNLAHLRITDAFLMNPLVCIGIILLLLWGEWSLITLVGKRRIDIELTSAERKVLIGLILLGLVINWSYLIWAGR